MSKPERKTYVHKDTGHSVTTGDAVQQVTLKSQGYREASKKAAPAPVPKPVPSSK